MALPKLQAKTPSVRRTLYLTAPGTAAQDNVTPRSIGVAVTTGAAVGPPAQPALTTGGVAQARPWRAKACDSACMCGVPSARLPLSSSTARKLMYADVAGH